MKVASEAHGNAARSDARRRFPSSCLLPPEDASEPLLLPHSLLDDVQGFLIGGVFCSLGVSLFGVCGLMTGGTAGLAFLPHLLGMGVLAFVRHGSSLGGINILAVYLQKTSGLRAGNIQIGVDVVLSVAAFLVLEPAQVLYSALGALVLGVVLALNHRPGRYMGV